METFVKKLSKILLIISTLSFQQYQAMMPEEKETVPAKSTWQKTKDFASRNKGKLLITTIIALGILYAQRGENKPRYKSASSLPEETIPNIQVQSALKAGKLNLSIPYTVSGENVSGIYEFQIQDGRPVFYNENHNILIPISDIEWSKFQKSKKEVL